MQVHDGGVAPLPREVRHDMIAEPERQRKGLVTVLQAPPHALGHLAGPRLGHHDHNGHA